MSWIVDRLLPKDTAICNITIVTLLLPTLKLDNVLNVESFRPNFFESFKEEKNHEDMYVCTGIHKGWIQSSGNTAVT